MTKVNMEREQATLDFVRTFITEHGFAPSVRDIGDALNMGTSTAHKYLVRLKQQGLVSWEAGRARTFRVVEQQDGTQ